MASIEKIEVNNTSYDVRDTHVGDLTSLTTTSKSSVVSAINELDADIGNISEPSITYDSQTSTLVITTS